MSAKSAIHALTSQQGAVFEDEAGWQMPAHYGDPLAEYRHAIEHAALFDLSHEGKVEVTGKDAAAFLHNMCTNDVRNLARGAGCEAFLTTGQAKVVAYVLIEHGRTPDDRDVYWLETAPGTAGRVVQHLDHYLISEQVELADSTSDFAEFHLAGPEAATVLGQALGGLPPVLAELQHQSVTFGAAEARICRHDRLGLPGFDIWCRGATAAAVWQALCQGGVRPAGLRAYHLLRVEAGTPVYGLDIDETNLPQEVGRTEQAISFTKGCYIGQETVARIRTYGHVNRSLVGLKLAGDGPVPSGAKLFRAGQEVGQVTSSVLSPRLGSAIALAYVRRGNQEPGTALEVEAAGEQITATVVPLPFPR
jgi:folate-binding protein YgfZ